MRIAASYALSEKRNLESYRYSVVKTALWLSSLKGASFGKPLSFGKLFPFGRPLSFYYNGRSVIKKPPRNKLAAFARITYINVLILLYSLMNIINPIISKMKTKISANIKEKTM